MESRTRKVARVWRSHRGLMVLLLVGLMISLLAVVAPQAWATPDHNRLPQEPTIPELVGGETVPANNLALLAPVLGLALVVVGVSTAALVWRRRHS